MTHDSRPLRTGWTPDSIPYDAIDRGAVVSDPVFFHGLVASSFLEITSSLYTRNLLEYYADDAEIRDWLRETWEPEELNHGHAMRRYVQTVWPSYDWERAYASFYRDYGALCVVESFHGSRALEMLARCVTETEAAVTYQALAAHTQEPVLRALLERMYRDEVRHYGHFLRYFAKYDASERNGALRILHTLLRRTSEAADADVGTTLEHIGSGWTGRPGVAPLDARELKLAYTRIARAHCDYGLARRMLLRPLGWSPESRRGALVERMVRLRLEFESWRLAA